VALQVDVLERVRFHGNGELDTGVPAFRVTVVAAASVWQSVDFQIVSDPLVITYLCTSVPTLKLQSVVPVFSIVKDRSGFSFALYVSLSVTAVT
jgi:hypothetical protein